MVWGIFKLWCYWWVQAALSCIVMISHGMHQVSQQSKKRVPSIVYNSQYTPCDSWFGKSVFPYLAYDINQPAYVYDILQQQYYDIPQRTVSPVCVTYKQLESVHSKRYLDVLKQSSAPLSHIFKVCGLQSYFLRWLPYDVIQSRVLQPLQWTVGGTVLTLELAKKHGSAMQIGGGYTQAEQDRGCNACVFNDIAFAIESLRKTVPDLRPLIIDLSKEVGSGYVRYYNTRYNTNNRPVRIFDIHKVPNDCDDDVVNAIDRKFAFAGSDSCDGDAYHRILKHELPDYINTIKKTGTFNPNLIIYNASTTPWYYDDVRGGLNLSEQDIIDRDQFVWQQACDNNIPIAMLFSGGKTTDSANVTAASICNILNHFTPNKANKE